jgi:hypothetical protein
MFSATKLFVFASVLAAGCAGATEQDEIVSNLVEAGYPADDISIVDGKVYVGFDAEVSLAASREMIQTVGSAEQYRTTNLVGTGVSKICVVPTSAYAAEAQLMAGLDLAIENYNQRNLRITFARGAAADCTATITARTLSGTVGGSAGFPSGGLPYGEINIGTGLNSYSLDVTEHVITHELGHCIGFRHSDYYNRRISCGGGGRPNEGDAGIGAILIPGTPSTATVGGSVMNSCFRSTENGEWTSTDIIALDYLY